MQISHSRLWGFHLLGYGLFIYLAVSRSVTRLWAFQNPKPCLSRMRLFCCNSLYVRNSQWNCDTTSKVIHFPALSNTSHSTGIKLTQYQRETDWLSFCTCACFKQKAIYKRCKTFPIASYAVRKFGHKVIDNMSGRHELWAVHLLGSVGCEPFIYKCVSCSVTRLWAVYLLSCQLFLYWAASCSFTNLWAVQAIE